MKTAGNKTEINKRIEELRNLARIGAVMVDGDVAMRIISTKSAYHIANPHPKFRYMAGDYYNVDHASFLLLKKTLLRLQRLVSFMCDATLWVRVEGTEDLITVAVQNGRLHRYYRFGENGRKMEGDLAKCIKSGKVITAPVSGSDKYLTVLAPVSDSLGEVIGCVEFSAEYPSPKDLPPAWS